MEQANGSHSTITHRGGIAEQIVQVGGDDATSLIGDEGIGDKERSPAGDEGEDGQRGNARLDGGQDNLPPQTQARAAVN